MGGLCSPEKLCLRAKEYGASCIALTDTNGLYGVPEFLKAAKENELKAIIGSEIRCDEFHFVVLVKKRKGYKALCEYLTLFHHEKINLRQTIAFFSERHEHLIFFTYDKSCLEQMHTHLYSHLYFELSIGFFNHNDFLWAQELGIKTLANNKVHYLDSDDLDTYKLVRAIGENKTFGDVDTSKFHNENCFMQSPKSIEEFFQDIYPQALIEMDIVAKDLDSQWFYQGDVSPGYNGLTETSCDAILREKCLSKISDRYDINNKELYKKVKERILYEMNIISQKQFSSYFLNIEDIASQCDYTCGRGSSAASIINYLLKITHVDPIAENLLFDRFMNLDRMDPPDIDVDFPSDQRDDVLDYIFDKFKGRAAMVANHNYLRGRSALREVAKVFGVKEDEISYTLDRFETLELNEVWCKISHYAQKVEGVIRHLSVHCGGVIITPERIDHYVPVEMSKKGYTVIQWEKDQTEMAGLIKTDILGNKGLSVIRDVINTVNERGREQIVYQELNALDDIKARSIFERGQTVGVVHFESPRCKTLLAAFNDASLSTLSIVCSIIRPAAMTQVSEILRRFRGGVFRYPHPILAEVLGETKGVMVYQEDVMRVTKALAGFSSQEGNELRKVLAKKHKAKKLKFYKEKFFEGCYQSHMTEENIELLWKDILSFSGYSFCKPHSDSYSLVAYKSAYLKAHYPAEFMAAVISNGGGFYIGNVEDYLNEARRMGVIILPPDIILSDFEYKGSYFEIRVGLKQIKHINLKTVKKIQGEKENGFFTSLENFLERVHPSFNDARILVKARCFGSVRTSEGGEKMTHTQIMWRVYEYYAKKKGQLAIEQNLPILKTQIPEYDKIQLINWEREFLNGFVTFPSWFFYRDLLKQREIIPGTSLKFYVGRDVILYGQKVTQKRVGTKYKEAMAFVTFSDDTCMFNATFFPRVYEESRDLLFLGGSYLIQGRVECDLGGFQVNVSLIQRVGEV